MTWLSTAPAMPPPHAASDHQDQVAVWRPATMATNSTDRTCLGQGPCHASFWSTCLVSDPGQKHGTQRKEPPESCADAVAGPEHVAHRAVGTTEAARTAAITCKPGRGTALTVPMTPSLRSLRAVSSMGVNRSSWSTMDTCSSTRWRARLRP